MKPQERGDLTEAVALHRLMKSGFSVSQPFDDNQRYDFIVDNGRELNRVQVKTARYKGDKLIFNCANSVANTVEVSNKTYTADEIDAFVVFSPALDTVYWVDIDDAPTKAMTLRTEPTKSGQTDGINWAEDFEL